MVESYAVTVQYYVSSLIYGRTKAGDLLQHDSHPDYTKVGPSLICNGVTVEDLQNTVIYSATFAEWMQKIWEVPRVQDKLDRSVFDLILDNPYRLILDNYNEMLKGPEHTSVGVKNDYYINSRYMGDVEVLSFEISGEGYNIESDAKQEHFYVTFSTRGKRTITLTVNHLKLNTVLRAVMEVDVADPPEIIACACRVCSRVSGTEIVIRSKTIQIPLFRIGQSDGMKTVSSWITLPTSSFWMPPPKNTFISYRDSEANMSSKPHIEQESVLTRRWNWKSTSLLKLSECRELSHLGRTILLILPE